MNQLEYRGKPKQLTKQLAFSLDDMNQDDYRGLRREHVKDLIQYEVGYGATGMAVAGIPGMIAGTTTGMLS